MGNVNWGSTATDTASGAAAGTAIMPGIGTAIGAGAGFLAGVLPGLLGGAGQATAAQSQFSSMSPDQQQAFLAQMQAQQAQAAGGAGQQNESALASSLFSQMNGGGPDLAGTELKSALQQQDAAAGSLMSSQRGLDPALAARNALQAQSANQQASAGQAAQLRQQQQLAAQQQLGQVSANQAGQAINLFGEDASQYQGLQSLNQQTAAQNAALQNAVNMGNAGQTAQMVGAGAGAAGTGLAGIATSGSGGGVGSSSSNSGYTAPTAPVNAGNNPLSPGTLTFAHGGQIPGRMPIRGRVPVMESPGEKPLPPHLAHSPVAAYMAAAHGAAVPGRAAVAGDSSRNDTVLRMEKPGTVILPRTVANKPSLAASFVAHLNKTHGLPPQSYGELMKKLGKGKR